jgi:hypothetical protein
LCAVGTCLALMSEESILRLLIGHSSDVDWPRYIQSTSSSDQDSQCRALAQRIAATISQSLQSISL